MFYLINKPRGISSHTAVNRLKKKLGLSRVGHAGTLDQEAEGLLLVATEGATPLLNYLVGQDKTYEYTLDLSRTSPSYDLSRESTSIDCLFPTYEQIEQVITHHFTGSLRQVPPSYSAIWIDGKRSYELALRGEEVNLSARSIEVYSHEILEYCAPFIKLRCRVSSGTYIRSFARDIANCLQTGGVITHLKRTHIGHYSLSASCDIEDISRDKAYPLEYFFPLSETIVTTPSQLKDIKNGDLRFLVAHRREGNILLVDEQNHPLSLIYSAPVKEATGNIERDTGLLILAQLYPREGKRGTIGSTRSGLE